MEIELKDFVLLVAGFVLGFLSNWLFSLRSSNKAEKLTASYHLDQDGGYFYNEYTNGYGEKRYTRRPVSGGEAVEVSESDFLKVKPSMEQRAIP